MKDVRTSAVVLAGGKASPELQAVTGVTNRALLRIGDQTMLDYVVDALAQSSHIGDVYVVGDVPSSSRYSSVPDAGSLFDNIVAGLAAVNAVQALVATSDIPFLTSAAVDDFVSNALARDVDIAYPIVSMDAYRKRFSEMKRTTVRLREGEFTGGNIMLLRSAFITGQPERIRQAYAARKNVLRLGALLGPGLLMRLVVSQTLAPNVLSLPMLEAGVSRILGNGSRVAAVITDYPEIGTDVDKPDDVAAAERLLVREASR
jgi:GTP:adenosylcobinamide-phosphate guanylyltransferase